MGILVFKSDVVLEFVPSYGGNREDKSPCVIGLKYVSHAKVQEYATAYTKRTTGLEAKETDTLSEITRYFQKKQFLDNVISVSGIFDGSREITDVTEFYDMAPQPLVFEIMAALENPVLIKAGLLKKPARGETTAKKKKGKG